MEKQSLGERGCGSADSALKSHTQIPCEQRLRLGNMGANQNEVFVSGTAKPTVAASQGARKDRSKKKSGRQKEYEKEVSTKTKPSWNGDTRVT